MGTFEDWLREGSDRAHDDQSSDSSVSNFSQRSWYGSVTRMTEVGAQMSPVSTPPRLTDSDSSSSEDDTEYARQSIRYIYINKVAVCLFVCFCVCLSRTFSYTITYFFVMIT